LFLDEVISLSTTLKLVAPNRPRLVGADVVGAVSDDPVSVHVSPGVDQWSSIVIDGRFGTVSVAIAVAVDTATATIRGTVDGEQVELTAARSETDWRTLRIEGRWPGPLVPARGGRLVVLPLNRAHRRCAQARRPTPPERAPRITLLS
jgi:hypothetical protein